MNTSTELQKPWQPSGWGKFWAAIGFCLVVFFVSTLAQIAGMLGISQWGADFNAVMAATEVLSGTLALVFMAVLGGKQEARPHTQGLGTAFKAAIWLFVVNGAIVLIGVASIALGYEQLEIASSWPARMLVLVVMCLGIGMFEEGLLRGLLLNGLLARFGGTRAGVFGAVLFTSFAFGMMHWDPFINFSDPLQVAQNCMKVLQTGLCGYLFAAIFVKTHNIWGPILVHAANDFLLMWTEIGLTETEVDTTYVMEASEGGAETLTLYIVLCALYIPFVYVGTRLINQSSPWRGAFWTYGNPGEQPGGQPIPTATAIEQPTMAAPLEYPAGPIAPTGPATPVVPQAVPAPPVAAPPVAALQAGMPRGKHAAPPQPAPQPVPAPPPEPQAAPAAPAQLEPLNPHTRQGEPYDHI